MADTYDADGNLIEDDGTSGEIGFADGVAPGSTPLEDSQGILDDALLTQKQEREGGTIEDGTWVPPGDTGVLQPTPKPTLDTTQDFRGDSPLGSSYITEASTVKGQLESLLSEDSRYMQEARQKAQEASAGRGLLNTTAAARAGERAAIESALPIATADAASAAGFQAGQQSSDIQSGQSTQDFTQNKALSYANYEQTLDTMDQASQERMKEADQQFGFTSILQETDQAFQNMMSERGYDEAARVLITNAFNTLGQAFVNNFADMSMSTNAEAGEMQTLIDSYQKIAKGYGTMWNYEFTFGEV